jgi:hypothetical protein
VVVAVRVHGRPHEAVVADLVEGVVAANRLTVGEAAELRRALMAAVLGEEEASAA